MKKLYLVRHAKSSWSNPELADFDRPLNKRGKRDAPFMGEILKKNEVQPEIIFSSPAKRALKTAKKISGILGYPKNSIVEDENIYDASTYELLELINHIGEEYKSAMLFGHNPGLTSLSNLLSDDYIDNIPTTGIVLLTFKGMWQELKENSCKLEFFEYPKKYFN